jgi:hypothetical protein
MADVAAARRDGNRESVAACIGAADAYDRLPAPAAR